MIPFSRGVSVVQLMVEGDELGACALVVGVDCGAAECPGGASVALSLPVDDAAFEGVGCPGAECDSAWLVAGAELPGFGE